MSTSLLSTLSRGFGSWTGVIDGDEIKHETLPSLDSPQHRHGITPRSQTSLSGVLIADGGHLDLPKTYSTRKGALMLFTAPDEHLVEPQKYVRANRKLHKERNLIDLSLKLKTLERLSLSILQFGEKSHEQNFGNISDKESNLFVKFLHDLSQEENDLHSQPGADFTFYLKDLKRRASSRTHSTREATLYRARSSELQDILDELEKAWPHHREQSYYSSQGEEFFHSPSPTPSLTTRALSRHRILSSKKLTSSLKSVTYMGRPITPESIDILQAQKGIWGRSKSAVTSASSSEETAQRKRPQTAKTPDRHIASMTSLDNSEKKTLQTLKMEGKTSEGLADDIDELTTSKQETESVTSEIDIELSDNEWYENTIKVSKTVKMNQSDETGDRESMLAEAATILSSLAEDEDIDVPFGDNSVEEDFHEWPGNEQKHESKEQLYIPRASSHSPDKEKNLGLVQPLRPQYSNVMSETDNSTGQDEDHNLRQVLSRGSLITPFPSTRGASPFGDEEKMLVQANNNNDQVTDVADDAELLSKKQEARAAKLAAMEYLLKPSLQVQDAPKLPQDESAKIVNNETVDEEFTPESIPVDIAPKRRPKPIEIKTAELIAETEEQKDVPVQGTSDTDKPQFSERTLREKEERERRSAKRREEKEKAEAKKQEEEEKIRKEKEEKVRAAEERLKRKAEEAARLKEEKAKEEENRIRLQMNNTEKLLKVKDASLKPSPPHTNKQTSTKASKTDKSSKPTIQNVKQDSEPVKGKMSTPIKQTINPPPRQKIVVQKQESQIPEHMKEMFARKSAQETEREMEEEIIKMKQAVNNVLGGSIMTVVDESEVFTEEDFKAAQEVLKEKIKKAEEDILENASPRTESRMAARKMKPEKVAPVPKKGKVKVPDVKKDLVKEREALREQQRLEKQRRLEEAKALQQKIHMKEEARKSKEVDAKRKAEELRERMDSIRREEEELERAEQDAREQLAAVRKIQREEREARRKAELEHKKQEALAKREKEKNMAIAARLKEQEMLESITDAEMSRRLKEEEEARREEEEMEAQERLELEFLEAQKAAEEEEERLRELERQAEEEAFQKLLLEKEEAEERRWKLEEQARLMREEEERQQQEMLEEEKRLEAERKKQEQEEDWRRAQERARLKELQILEEEARQRLQAELEKRRVWALQRRDKNLEVRSYMDRIKQSQGITEPWTFSYFVKWPKENYMRLMGADPKKMKGAQKPKVKTIKENSPETKLTAPAADLVAEV